MRFYALVVSGFDSQGDEMGKNRSKSEVDWNWVIAAPWDPMLLFEFNYLEKEMKRAVPMVLEEELKASLHRYFAHLIHLVDFCGCQNTWARLAESWNQEGVPMNRAWTGAAIGGELAMAAIHELAVRVFSIRDGESLLVTPLHFWVITESCRWMRLDLIPQCEESGGLPFGNREELEKDLQRIESHFCDIDEILEGEFNPYARIRIVGKEG